MTSLKNQLITLQEDKENLKLSEREKTLYKKYAKRAAANQAKKSKSGTAATIDYFKNRAQHLVGELKKRNKGTEDELKITVSSANKAQEKLLAIKEPYLSAQLRDFIIKNNLSTLDDIYKAISANGSYGNITTLYNAFWTFCFAYLFGENNVKTLELCGEGPRIELKTYSFRETSNKYIKLIKKFLTFCKNYMNKSSYNTFHNLHVDNILTEKDILGIGEAKESNIIFCADLWKIGSTDPQLMKDYLKLQKIILTRDNFSVTKIKSDYQALFTSTENIINLLFYQGTRFVSTSESLNLKEADSNQINKNIKTASTEDLLAGIDMFNKKILKLDPEAQPITYTLKNRRGKILSAKEVHSAKLNEINMIRDALEVLFGQDIDVNLDAEKSRVITGKEQEEMLKEITDPAKIKSLIIFLYSSYMKDRSEKALSEIKPVLDVIKKTNNLSIDEIDYWASYFKAKNFSLSQQNTVDLITTFGKKLGLLKDEANKGPKQNK